MIFITYYFIHLYCKYRVYSTYKICINLLFMLSVKLLVNSRLLVLVIKFWESKKLYVDFSLHGMGVVSAPNLGVVQGWAVLII